MAKAIYTPTGFQISQRVDAFNSEATPLAVGAPIYSVSIANQHNRRISVLTSYDRASGELHIDIVETGV
jgi:hypothetical protein